MDNRSILYEAISGEINNKTNELNDFILEKKIDSFNSLPKNVNTDITLESIPIYKSEDDKCYVNLTDIVDLANCKYYGNLKEAYEEVCDTYDIYDEVLSIVIDNIYLAESNLIEPLIEVCGLENIYTK